MRFSTAAFLASLPLLASADVPEYQAQFNGFADKFMAWAPSPSIQDPVDAAEAKAGAKKMDVLTLNNWRDVLYQYVAPEATTPEETWVFITGRNKTCYGQCLQVEAAWNETAAKFAELEGAPHTAYLNCDNEPVLCNAWSVPVSAIWVFEMLPPPSPIDIWTKRLNITTTTSEDIVDLQQKGIKTEGVLHDGAFHPFNGWVAKNGLSIPFGYVIWVFGLFPSWMFMVGLSLLSRTMMSNRMNGQFNQRARAAGQGQPPAGQAAPRR